MSAAAITPVAVPADAAGVLVVGGSFDPPHRWHVTVAEAARRAVCPDGWIVFVPAARSPFKERGPEAPDGVRVEMLREATRGVARCAVWTDEVDRAAAAGGGPSYTVETLRRLAVVLPGVARRLLIGADQAAAFHKWREARGVIALAPPAVVLRPPVETAEQLVTVLRGAGSWSEMELAAWRGWVVEAPVAAVSSTEVRGLVRGGAGDAALLRAVEPGVLRVIRERGVYR